MSLDDTSAFVYACDLDDVPREEPFLVSTEERPLAIVHHEGDIHAVDNRCPHMGFPLSEGSVDDGILTCPWHHARFEVSCGDTFDPFADDVQTYPVELRDDEVYVDPHPERDRDPAERWSERLDHGLQENLSLVVAKSVIGLDDADVAYTTPVDIGVDFGTHYRREGWGRGLTTLGVMTNLLSDLRSEDRRRALYTGLTEVAEESAGEPPFFVQDPLSTEDVTPERLRSWFRDNIEVRDSDGAERVIRAAINAGLDENEIAGLLVAAATDHIYLDAGHRLDFINKAFETLDHVGWDRADDVLPSLVPGLASASRAEEASTWRQPIDVAALRSEIAEELPTLLAAGDGKEWQEPDGFVTTLLGDDPHDIADALTEAISAGATATELSEPVAHAAARRIAQFGTANEFRDWDTVHHTYTYSNAVHALSQRTDAPELYRGIFDAAFAVYFDRFLNTPPIPLPDPDGDRDPATVLTDLEETFEIEANEVVTRAGNLTAEYLAAGGEAGELKRTLGEALLREDVGFHTRQNVEAAFAQYDAIDEERARVHLVATARYLAAHTPTRRAGEQTFRIAERLNRGEEIHED